MGPSGLGGTIGVFCNGGFPVGDGMATGFPENVPQCTSPQPHCFSRVNPRNVEAPLWQPNTQTDKIKTDTKRPMTVPSETILATCGIVSVVATILVVAENRISPSITGLRETKPEELAHLPAPLQSDHAANFGAVAFGGNSARK